MNDILTPVNLLEVLDLTGKVTRGAIYLHEVVGIRHAVYSCTKPYFITGIGDYATFDFPAALNIADKLAWRANGENKFLRMIHANMEIYAPRDFWSHWDTYKIGVVAQSESTMHGLKKQGLNILQCEVGTTTTAVQNLNDVIASGASITEIKHNLPEGYLQSRVVNVSYAALQNMWYQRHVQETFGWWDYFLSTFTYFPYDQWIHKTDKSMTGRYR